MPVQWMRVSALEFCAGNRTSATKKTVLHQCEGTPVCFSIVTSWRILKARFLVTALRDFVLNRARFAFFTCIRNFRIYRPYSFSVL